MREMLQWLRGRRTYGVCIAVCVICFGAWQGWWKVPTEVYAGLSALAIGFLRAGVKGEIGNLLDQAEIETKPETQNPRSE